MTDTVGTYREQWCCLCERPILYSQVLHPGGVQCMDFGQKAHRKCYNARYHDGKDIDQEEQASMFEIERVGAASERE